MGKLKYKIVSELLDETMREISLSEENWCRFLTTSSRLYKYPFKEQVLIYAQRPDAIACASVEIWNHRMNCWINRGSKGIALIDEDRYGKLKYVFDVSDVHKGRWRGRLPYLWDMKEVHQEPVLKHLEELYGKTDENATFVERIRVIADRVTEETGKQLFYDMEELKKGSRLEYLDDANLRLRLQITLSDSVAYSILKRCGVSDKVLEDTIGFMYIPEFNTTDTLLLLGSHASELAKPVLIEIRKCIWAFDREQEKAQKQQRKKFEGRGNGKEKVSLEMENKNMSANRDIEKTGQTVSNGRADPKEITPGFGKSVETLLAEAESIKARKEAEKKAQNKVLGELSAHAEKKSNFGLVNSLEAHYNALNHESGDETKKVTQQLALGDERSRNGEIGIRTERGLHGTDASDGRTARGDSNEIRIDETTVPQGTQKRNLHGISAERNVERTSSDDSGTGRGENGSIGGTDGKSRGRDRTAQSGKSDALGTENEQHPPQSRRNRSEGIDLQVNNDVTTEIYEQMSLFPSFEEQVGTVMAAEADTIHVMPAVFSLSKEQIEEILRSGGGRRDNRKRIYAKYQQGKSPEEIAEFLKNEYGTTGKGFIFDDNPVAVWFDESGICAGYGTSAIENPFLWMSWQEAESHIRNMVVEGSYMSVAEAFLVDESERLRVANDIYYFFRDGVPDLWEKSEYHRNTAPESIEELCSLLSDDRGQQQIFSELEEAWQLLEQGIITKKWNYVKSPQYLMEQIEDLGKEKIFYPCIDHVEIRNEDFITKDEVNYRLTQGSGIEHGKFRIYEYFTEMHEKQERVDFLKEEYGIGGSSHALPGSDTAHENHDAKGIHIEKGSYTEPYTSVLLNWNVVEKRISELIKAGKYLTQEQMKAYAEYKQEKELRIAKSGLVERSELLQVAQMETPNPIKNDVDSMEMENATSLKRYEAIQTDDPYEPTFAVWDNQAEDYYKIDEVVWLFDTEIEAIDFAEELNEQELLQTSITMDWKEKDSLSGLHSFEQENHPNNTEENLLFSSVIQTENLKKMQTIDNLNQIDSVNQTPSLSVASLQDIAEPKAVNFHITLELETSSKGFAPKEKFHQNIEAIRTLKIIEAEHRIATPEEQEILAKYVGWGGLSDAFNLGNVNWHKEYQELKNLLSSEEYVSARESILNAHYTSPAIIQGIYDVIDGMGFSQGTILEPAMGTGHFFGMLPEQMRQSKLYGVELDGISGRIAKQLYPNANIQISGFEKTDFPNDFFNMAIGNVPFGQYKVSDREYDKYNLSVHDYFLVKSLDKVKPNGIAAFITSKSTMDKRNPTARKLMAQRGELIGAIRLPNTAFKENAGTEVTSDILFFRKYERMMELEPDWLHISKNEAELVMNSYFMEHPEMILGRMEMKNGPYGKEAVCLPDLSVPLSEQLKKAGAYIIGQTELEHRDFADNKNSETQIESTGVTSDESQKLTEVENMDVVSARNETPWRNNSIEVTSSDIPADPNVKNYSYAIVQNQVYYRENSIMKRMDLPETTKERIKAMVQIRDYTQELIELQMEEFPDTLIQGCQAHLNRLYDAFSEKYGLIHSQANKRAFSQDSSYYLLCSLENLDENGNFKGKADMFSKRTIRRAEAVTSVDTATEALAVSLSEKAGIDLPYMESLTGKTQEEIIGELKGVIFMNPFTEKWETADEYLSGNIRDKLNSARIFAEHDSKYAINVSALEQVQPKELEASEIEVRIGATWIDTRYIEDFMCEIFETPEHYFDRNVMSVQYSDISGQWNIKGKNADYGNTLVNMTYGTSRANAYRILEDSLNLKDVRIFDTVVEDGKEKRILNKKETMLASQKQESIREKFKDWIFQEPKRRNVLCKKYNELFNSTRPREYEGSHLKFPGMTESITLRPHQLNAVAHQIYGNNTLLAHTVGAGKTFSMIAAAMESKRLGLCQKSMFVVPNHLTEQWASDFMRLYPGANILAATKKDFEPANRKKFCSRISTGDYDAVIIGHTQFERIPLSAERQRATIENQIEEIQTAIELAKAEKGENYTIKQMEKTRKQLLVRLEKLSAEEKKDNVVTFEQLGVDRLFVDESHSYKNLFLYTKMRNVAGIAQTEAQKSSDMFAKCRYMDEITGGKGITFATGTPIANSMTELYTNMRYLQYDILQKLGLGNFDAWASTFGETQTSIELAPEGTGYRAKTRFAKFFNIPELISLFKESADIQTPDMLKLPVPEAEYENIVLKPSEYQKEIVKSLADRAEAVRSGTVEPTVDNLLKITNDGRKLALDQRLINPLLPDNENSKSVACVEKAFQIWKETWEQKSTQLIFCDLSTPKGDGSFNIYDDIRQKLVAKGVPEAEVKFIHEANTETQKAELFAKVRSGQVRFLLGSTAKLGAGTNLQDRLIALHHMDIHWRPADIQQQEGRILRQGNQNEKVWIFRYITKQTFDSYSWQVIENKQKFIGQIMTSKSPVRSCEDVDEAALSYAEVKALATGNPHIKEKMLLDIEVSKLKLLKANHTNQKYRLEDNITQRYPKQIAQLKEEISNLDADITHYAKHRFSDKETFYMKVGNRLFTEKKEAGAALLEMCKNTKSYTTPVEIGKYQGFQLCVHYRVLSSKFVATLKGKMGHEVELGTDALGNLQRMNNLLDGMTTKLEETKQKLLHVERQLETAKTEVTKPFAQEIELKEKQERLNSLNSLLNMNEKDFSMLGADNPETETTFNETNVSYESITTSNQTIVAEDVVYDFRQKTENLFHKIDGQSASEIEQTVWDYIDSKTQENTLDVQIEDVVLTGSRSRGLEQSGSDLDIVVEYKGKEREDNFFEMLHEDNLTIGGIPVDINPIKEEKSGTLQTYLPKAEQYLTQKQKVQEKSKRISIREKLKEKRAEVQNREQKCLEQKEVGKKKLDRNISL